MTLSAFENWLLLRPKRNFTISFFSSNTTSFHLSSGGISFAISIRSRLESLFVNAPVPRSSRKSIVRYVMVEMIFDSSTRLSRMTSKLAKEYVERLLPSSRFG